jgi:hypothetical protein
MQPRAERGAAHTGGLALPKVTRLGCRWPPRLYEFHHSREQAFVMTVEFVSLEAVC